MAKRPGEASQAVLVGEQVRHGRCPQVRISSTSGESQTCHGPPWSWGKSDGGSGVVICGAFPCSSHCVLGCCQLDSSILAFLGGPISEQMASFHQQTVDLGRKTVDRKPETVGMANAGEQSGPHRERPFCSHKRKMFSLTDHNQLVR